MKQSIEDKLAFARARTLAVGDLEELRAAVNAYEGLGPDATKRFEADAKGRTADDVVRLKNKHDQMDEGIKDLIQNQKAVEIIASHAATYLQQHSTMQLTKMQAPLSDQLTELEKYAEGPEAEKSWRVDIAPGSNFKNFMAKAELSLELVNSDELMSRIHAVDKAGKHSALNHRRSRVSLPEVCVQSIGFPSRALDGRNPGRGTQR